MGDWSRRWLGAGVVAAGIAAALTAGAATAGAATGADSSSSGGSAGASSGQTTSSSGSRADATSGSTSRPSQRRGGDREDGRGADAGSAADSADTDATGVRDTDAGDADADSADTDTGDTDAGDTDTGDTADSADVDADAPGDANGTGSDTETDTETDPETSSDSDTADSTGADETVTAEIAEPEAAEPEIAEPEAAEPEIADPETPEPAPATAAITTTTTEPTPAARRDEPAATAPQAAEESAVAGDDAAEAAGAPPEAGTTTDTATATATDTDTDTATAALATPADPGATTRDAETSTTNAATLAMAAAPTAAEAASALPRRPILSLIGAVFFGVYNLALRVLEGPPVLPAGSTVTVSTSKLSLDCGNGLEVPANWYVPEDPDPDRLIYLQHGFFASAPLYSYTAAVLAERTHSIVVATSLTSNFLACDGCWLGGDSMHRAVAELFAGDRAALTESASAAVGHDVTLPTAFVLVGHSAGGGLALGAASHMDEATRADLAGILLLDGVAFGGVSPDVVAELPADLPILQIASRPYMWNMFGITTEALVQARPDTFNGVELVGGSHIDTMQGANRFFQFSAYLVAGFSTPQNVAAAQLLAPAWVDEMFDGGTDYGQIGQEVLIDTEAGTATALGLPAGESSLPPFKRLLRTVVVAGARALFSFLAPAPAQTVAHSTAGSAGTTPELEYPASNAA